MQYIYLIQSGEYYKIGIANDPKSRLAQLQTGNPIKLQLVFCYGFEDASAVERVLHQKYTDLRINGEWFGFDHSPEYEFSQICFMLGGKSLDIPQSEQEAELEEVEEAEEIQETLADGEKFDYSQMFADGWRMETVNENGKKRNWVWRRGNGETRKTIYGGSMNSLPYSIENMRRVYRDGLEPLAQDTDKPTMQEESENK